MNGLKLKVCGMREKANIELIGSLQPDFMGFIFYKGSKRKVESLDPAVTKTLPDSITKVGVFVNENNQEIEAFSSHFGFDHLQLHGDESPEQCRQLSATGFKIIKAFAMTHDFDFPKLDFYVPHCSYFLFDTPTQGYGGSGQKFDWNHLRAYNLTLPFFLSGGMDETSLEDIYKIDHPRLYAIDINSRFELSSGLKDFQKVKNFQQSLSNMSLQK